MSRTPPPQRVDYRAQLLRVTDHIHDHLARTSSPWSLASGLCHWHRIHHALADQPVFEEYLNSPLNTAPAHLLTDI